MMRHILWIAGLLPLSALAQLQVLVFNGITDTPASQLVNVGSVAPGDTLETRFHVRNTGAGPLTLQTLSLSGQGFTIVSAPSLPYILAPYVGPISEVELDVNFSPPSIGSYSAFLAVNSVNVALQGTAAKSAVVTISSGQSALMAGSAINFGSVVIHQSHPETFTLSNSTSSSLTVNSVTVSGSGFSGPTGAAFPLSIGPGQSSTFQVTFSPQSGTLYQGMLTVDGRPFTLTGQGLDPPLPSASIVFDSSVGASAQQNSLTIPLAAASEISGTGTLTMFFTSSVAAVTDDPAIQFLSGPFRQAAITIAPGATSATIGGASRIAFQTGTTAGTITFALTLEHNAPQQSTLTISPAMINLTDTVTAVRIPGALNIAFSTFDNTHSASQLGFTFYDLKGNALPQGAINFDANADFKQYFSGSQAGGAFALRAQFPVTGDTTQVGFVTAQITNALGTTTAPRVAIGN